MCGSHLHLRVVVEVIRAWSGFIYVPTSLQSHVQAYNIELHVEVMLLSFVKFQCDHVVNNRWNKVLGSACFNTDKHLKPLRPTSYFFRSPFWQFGALLTLQTGIKLNTADQHTHSCVEQVQPDCRESPNDKSRHVSSENTRVFAWG